MNFGKAKPAKKSKGPNLDKTTKKRKIILGTITAVLTIGIVGIISVSAVGFYMLNHVISYANDSIVIDLNEYMLNQDQTTLVYAYDKNGNEVELTRLHGVENRIWVNYSDLPVNLKNAYIALEDKRFMDHRGVDWYRTIAVVVEYKFSQGGSTITQQLIKNLTGESGRTFIRKYYEILQALNLEKHFSKEMILETYLNTLYLDEGCYGVQTASEFYFGKEVSELNLAESACLAAITQAPRKYNPIRNFKNNRKRQITCLNNMLDQGRISQEEYEEALNYELILTNSDKFVDEKNDGTVVDEKKTETNDYQSYYVDYVIDRVIADLREKYDYTYNQAWRMIYYGGLKIYTAVDLDIQSQMEDVYYNRISFPKEKDTEDNPAAQSAMTIMDYSGRLMGIIGRAGPKPGNRSLNIAANSPRQPGSAIKPLSVYTLGIEQNYIHWSSLMQDYGIVINGNVWPRNYDGSGSPDSYKTIQQAISPSLNTIPARLVQILTPQKCYSFLQTNFHFTTLKEADIDFSPMAVGGMSEGVTTLEMAAAYASFGNGGKYYEPYCYYKVTNYNGSTVYLQNDSAPEQIMSEATAGVMNKLLQTVVTAYNGTGRRYPVSGFTTFAKTGTTTDDKDRWFIGASPHYVGAVWFGYEIPKTLKGVSGNPAGIIFKEVMDRVHKDLPDKNFEDSEDIVRRAYCTKTGLLASDYCTSKAYGWYKYDFIPSTCTSCQYSTPIVEETEDPES